MSEAETSCNVQSRSEHSQHITIIYFHWPIEFVDVCDSQDEKVVDFECHHESGSSSLGWKGN